MQFFILGSSKIEVFESCFFDVMTTENDHPSYVEHVLGRIYVSFTLFGYWVRGGGGGVSQGIGTQPACAVSPPRQLKNRSLETCSFDIVTTQYDHPRYVKHVLGRIYMIFTLFGYWGGGGGGGGGGLREDWYTTCLCSFSPQAAQKSKILKLVFMIL